MHRHTIAGTTNPRWSPLAGLSFLFIAVLATLATLGGLGLTGCLGAPERCRGCLAALADAGPAVFDRSPPGTGGGIVGSGGAIGSGGMGTGGAATGGMGTGGAATGGMGTGGAATGGRGTGGAATGGMGTGGAATGGRGTGGAATGGMGGAATGGRGTGGAATGGAGTGGAAVDPDLVLWFKFDETTGMTIADSAMFGGTARNGTLTTVSTGTATFSTQHQVGTRALNLESSSATVGAYATALPGPGLQTLAPNAVTIALWVRVKTDQGWQRVFDFGNTATTPTVYMFLTANQAMSAPNSVRFTMSTMGTTMEQIINMTTPAALSVNVWHHIVIVLPAGSPYTGTMYIDGAVAGTNNAMTLHPVDLGATANNYLGRSQWAQDPYLDAYLDDFRIYRRALTAAEVTTLYAVR